MVGTEKPTMLHLETGLAPTPKRTARGQRDRNDDSTDRRHQRDEVGRLLSHEQSFWSSFPSVRIFSSSVGVIVPCGYAVVKRLDGVGDVPPTRSA